MIDYLNGDDFCKEMQINKEVLVNWVYAGKIKEINTKSGVFYEVTDKIKKDLSTNTIRIFNKENDLKELNAWTEKIFEYILEKSSFENRRHDQNYPTFLGNASFWLQLDPNTGETLLCYNTHPKNWNIQQIYADLENGLRRIYDAQGLLDY